MPGSITASLGPAPCFAACEGHLRSVVHVFVLVELELERHLRATHATKVKVDTPNSVLLSLQSKCWI